MSSYDTRFARAIVFAAQESPAEKQPGWIKRNRVLFGAALGFGIGFESGVALAGSGDFQTAEFGLLLGAIGAGVGALLGAVSR